MSCFAICISVRTHRVTVGARVVDSERLMHFSLLLRYYFRFTFDAKV